ncbi:MAG: hypothetical protein AMXMBFR25_11960 [Lysobacterales bacterium]|nr:hypothetical protein [Xanthomonadales bacterium]
MRQWWRGLPVALALLCAQAGRAEDWIGQPSLTRYTPADTEAQPYSFAVLPLASGEVFVGNADGLLRHFGRRWQTIEVPGAGTVRSLALGADGRIYLGGYQNFGVLERAPDGRYAFTSYERSFFPDSVGAPLGEIWDTVAVADGVWFATSLKLFFVGYDGSQRTLDLPSPLLAMFQPGGQPVVALRDRRLFQIQGGELRPWLRAAGRVCGLARQGPEQYWLLTDTGELYHIDGKLAQRRRHPAEAVLRAGTAYAMAALPDGGHAVGTLAGDIVRFDADFSHFQVWPVGDAPVIALGVDRENHLWAATEADIVRVSLSTAWSLFDRSQGLRGPVTHAAMHQGRLYVATSVGLYGAVRTPAGGTLLELIGLPQTEIHHLASTTPGLLVGAREGVYLWRDGRLRTVATGMLAWRLVPSRVVADRVYVVEDAGMHVLDREGDDYRIGQRFTDPAFRFDEIAEEADGSLWIDRLLDDPVRLRMQADGRTLEAPQAVPLGTARAPDGNATVFKLDGRILVASDQRLLVWDGAALRPQPQHPLIRAGFAPTDGLRVRTCGDGSVFAFDDRRLLRRDADPVTPFVELQPMDGGTRGILDLWCGDPDGRAFVATWNGIVRFDPAARSSPPPRGGPQMERVSLSTREGSTELLPLQADNIVLPPFRQLRFEYASPAISANVRFRSRLEGHEQQWVDGGEGSREFSALPAGDYVFVVRALDGAGPAGKDLRYPLRVAAAWWQTPSALLLGVATLALLFVLLLHWRSRTLKRRNEELEKLVSERTEALALRGIELEQLNKRLAELADADGLTGVANRRKLEYEMEGAWAAAKSSDGYLSLLLIDVDHFKRFNDSYGHLVGDERLRAIAERLKGWVGPGDLLARYGGEEFVLLMPGSTIDVARERAEAIRRDARHVGCDGEGSSVSIGVAERRKHKPGDTAQLFEFADLALYRAKNAGRDRVEVYTE